MKRPDVSRLPYAGARRRRRPGGSVVMAIASAALLVGCTAGMEAAPPPSTPSSPATGDPASPSAGPSGGSRPATSPTADDAAREVTPTGRPRDVTTGLGAPWSVVFRDGTALISERDSARILELLDDGTTRLVGRVPGVSAFGEAGLLGLAVDEGGRLYVYSTGERENRVQRFRLAGRPGSLTLGAPTTILRGIPAAATHNGGRIAFGPDGMLYVATGDAAVRSRAQDRGSLGGKILRITPDGDVPTDNPFAGSAVYSYGHRNVQGIAWAGDGTMFATEFGQDRWDELNVIEPGGNYGWPQAEGDSDVDGFVDPVQQWRPADASPSGLTVARGTIFVANLRGEVVRAVPVADPSTSTEHFSGRYGRIRDVTSSPDGDLWIVTHNTDGRGDPAPGDDRVLSVALE